MTDPVRSVSGDLLPPGVSLAALAARGFWFGAALGGTIQLLVLWLARTLLLDAPASDIPQVGPAFWVVTLGTLGAMGSAAATVWWALAPLKGTLRRGGLSGIAGFVVLVAAALATPVDVHYGRPGLLWAAGGLALLALVGGIALQRWYAALPE